MVLGMAVLGADVTGKWTAEFDTQIGVQKYTYEFKVDGTKLTGKAKGGPRIGSLNPTSRTER